MVREKVGSEFFFYRKKYGNLYNTFESFGEIPAAPADATGGEGVPGCGSGQPPEVSVKVANV